MKAITSIIVGILLIIGNRPTKHIWKNICEGAKLLPLINQNLLEAEWISHMKYQPKVVALRKNEMFFGIE